MWHTDCNLSEVVEGCVVDATEVQCTAPAPAPGEYAEREARRERLLYPLFVDANDVAARLDRVGSAERQSALVAVDPDAIFRVWTLLFGRPSDKRPSKSLLAQVAAALLGSRTSFSPPYLSADFDTVTSRWLARQYCFAQLRELVATRRNVAKRLAAARAFLLRHIARATVETGSTAANSKRMTPLGAPPQIA